MQRSPFTIVLSECLLVRPHLIFGVTMSQDRVHLLEDQVLLQSPILAPGPPRLCCYRQALQVIVIIRLCAVRSKRLGEKVFDVGSSKAGSRATFSNCTVRIHHSLLLTKSKCALVGEEKKRRRHCTIHGTSSHFQGCHARAFIEGNSGTRSWIGNTLLHDQFTASTTGFQQSSMCVV